MATMSEKLLVPAVLLDFGEAETVSLDDLDGKGLTAYDLGAALSEWIAEASPGDEITLRVVEES